VRQTLHAIDAGLVESDRDVLVHLAEERRGVGRQHAFDRLGIVTLAGGDELHGVAGLDLDQRGLEDHRALGSLVEHLHLDLGGAGGAREQKRGGCADQQGSHLHSPGFNCSFFS
jgi:hypothetical protein